MNTVFELTHLAIVANTAGSYNIAGLARSPLIQIATIGLVIVKIPP